MSSGADWAPEQSLPRFEPACRDQPASRRWARLASRDQARGFRILAHRRGYSVRLFSRNGYNFADRFSLAAAAIEALPIRSCVVDGEALVCDGSGLAVLTSARSTCSR